MDFGTIQIPDFLQKFRVTSYFEKTFSILLRQVMSETSLFTGPSWYYKWKK